MLRKLRNLKNRLKKGLGLCIELESPWPNSLLSNGIFSYAINNSHPKLSKADVEASFEEAFRGWKVGGLLPIEFKLVTSGARHLNISWVALGKNDPAAITEFPAKKSSEIPKYMLLNLDKDWKKSAGSAEYDLLTIAYHETGHALGLNHCDSSGVVMSDDHGPGPGLITLTSEDKAAIRLLYGTQPLAKLILAKVMKFLLAPLR